MDVPAPRRRILSRRTDKGVPGPTDASDRHLSFLRPPEPVLLVRTNKRRIAGTLLDIKPAQMPAIMFV